MNPRTFLFCTSTEWAASIFAGAAATILTAPWWLHISLWVAVFPAITVTTAIHFIYAARHIPPIPHIGILICCLQYGLAPWLAYYYPPDDPSNRYVISDYASYFAYAGPVGVAVTLGWLLALLGYAGTVLSPALDVHLQARVVPEMDLIFWTGMAATFLSRYFYAGSLAFVVVLVSNLRFVGAIGMLLLNARGWRWRIGFLLALETYLATGSGMFHSLLLWGAAVGAFYACFRRVTRPALFGALAACALLLFALQHAKWKIRQATWFGTSQTVEAFDEEFKLTPWNQPFVGVLCIADGMWRTLKWDWNRDFVSGTCLRYNQGWIINHVMRHVPANEPYARGETLWTAVTSSMLPRFLAPKKHIAGGKASMLRFAGLSLGEGTSMNLGFGGEMYANFGRWGGALACGLYALLLGLCFRWVAHRAKVSLLWWVFVPYVGHWALKAESGIPEVMNYMVKSVLVLTAVIAISPGLRHVMLRSIRKGPALPASPLLEHKRRAQSQIPANPPFPRDLTLLT